MRGLLLDQLVDGDEHLRDLADRASTFVPMRVQWQIDPATGVVSLRHGAEEYL